MGVAELQAKYAELFHESCRVNNKAWLVKRLAWRIQALAEGDLSERARQRANEIANDADLRLAPPKTRSTTETAPVPTGQRMAWFCTTTRPIDRSDDGLQFVLDDGSEPVYGVWLHTCESSKSVLLESLRKLTGGQKSNWRRQCLLFAEVKVGVCCFWPAWDWIRAGNLHQCPF
jgi:hypothetical protein